MSDLQTYIKELLWSAESDLRGKRKRERERERENTSQGVYNTTTSTCRVFLDVERRCGTTRQDPKNEEHEAHDAHEVIPAEERVPILQEEQ